MEKKRRRGLVFTIAALFLIGGAAVYYFVFAGPSLGEAAEATEGETISVMEAAPGMVALRVEGPSVVEPFRLQEIRSTISGTVLRAPSIGDSVGAGSVIVEFDATNLRTALRQAELNLAQAELDRDRAELTLAQAEATLADRERLYGEGTIARDQVTAARDIVSNAQLAVQAAAIKVSQSELALATARADLDSAVVRAPFSGVVLASDVVAGENVGGGALLLTIADVSRVRLSAEVDEYDIGKIEPNMQVEITSDALGEESIRSRVERISPAAQIVNNISIFTVTTVVDNAQGKLRPGMSADLSILVSSDRGLIVPSKVVSTVRDRSYLEIFDGTEVKTIRVVAGADDGVNVAILEGLEEGAMVVIPSAGGLVLSSGESTTGSSIIPISVPGTGGGSR
jgi:RND family efflux transporter MFP subunit